MALTTLSLSAEEAKQPGLVDIVDENLDAALKRMSTRLLRLESGSVENLKRYMRDMWIVNEQMEELAITESYRFASNSQVREKLKRFVEQGRFPWE